MLKFVRRKWRIFAVGVGLIILALLVLAIPTFREKYDDYQQSKIPISKVSGGRSAYEGRISNMLKTPPTATASTADKLEYYRILHTSYADLQKYNEAVIAFKELEKVAPDALIFEDYFALAGYYVNLKDKDNANLAVDSMVQHLPATSDPKNGYLRPQMQREVDYYRQEIQEL